jgi:uncharacterized protein (DUF58 family)
MNKQTLLALLSLVVGIPCAAIGLANGNWLLAILGLVLVWTFAFQVFRWMAKAGKPEVQIKPAANAAWTMKDQPAPGAPSTTSPTPSAAADSASGSAWDLKDQPPGGPSK